MQALSSPFPGGEVGAILFRFNPPRIGSLFLLNWKNTLTLVTLVTSAHFRHLRVCSSTKPFFRDKSKRAFEARVLYISGGFEMDLKGKKVIIIGERDGIQGPAIAECVKSAGAEPVLVQTQCFV